MKAVSYSINMNTVYDTLFLPSRSTYLLFQQGRWPFNPAHSPLTQLVFLAQSAKDKAGKMLNKLRAFYALAMPKVCIKWSPWLANGLRSFPRVPA